MLPTCWKQDAETCDEGDYNEDDMESAFENDSIVADLLPLEHHGCFVHTLQLVIKDGFTKAR